MCFMCKLAGHWVADCADGGASHFVWVSDYNFVAADNSGPVDARGVNLVGVGDPDDRHNPDFLAAESTLAALDSAAGGHASGDFDSQHRPKLARLSRAMTRSRIPKFPLLRLAVRRRPRS